MPYQRSPLLGNLLLFIVVPIAVFGVLVVLILAFRQEDPKANPYVSVKVQDRAEKPAQKKISAERERFLQQWQKEYGRLCQAAALEEEKYKAVVLGKGRISACREHLRVAVGFRERARQMLLDIFVPGQPRESREALTIAKYCTEFAEICLALGDPDTAERYVNLAASWREDAADLKD